MGACLRAGGGEEVVGTFEGSELRGVGGLEVRQEGALDRKGEQRSGASPWPPYRRNIQGLCPVALIRGTFRGLALSP
eukprot:250577-Chlamydomonas_euryale.AAC.1